MIIDRIAESLFDKIRGRFPEIRIWDAERKKTLDPANSRIFNFDFNESFDNVTISIIDEKSLKIYYDLEAPRILDAEDRTKWYKFLRNMRFFAQRNDLTYDVRDIAKSGLSLSDLDHLYKDKNTVDKNSASVSEGKMYGTRRSSYQKIGEVRIIVRHSKPIVDENNSRARGQNIDALYIENILGERHRLPTGTTLTGARVYARHVKNGGNIHDDFGQHITKILSEMSSLRTFVRNMRGRQFEDAETRSMVESAINHYGKLHRDMFTIRGQRGYDQYKALWQPEIAEADDYNIDELKDRFVRRVFDERLTDALPVVRRAYLADKSKVVQEFEDWANNLVEDPDKDVNTRGPLSNPNATDVDISADSDGNFMDGDSADQFLTDLFDKNGFDYRYQNSTYYFESREELERAKDVIAAADATRPMPKMGVSDDSHGVYGATTFDRELPNNKGVSESVDDIEIRLYKKIVSLTK
jgi:hypothetical protein